MQEKQVWYLGQEEDTLEEEIATHSSIPAGKITIFSYTSI